MDETVSSTPAYRVVEESLRRQILKGDLRPGDRLPTNREFVMDFGVSLQTVQRGISQLVEDGFVETRGRSGTVVAESPAHLCDFVLVLENPVVRSGYQSLFGEAMLRAAGALELDEQRTISTVHIQSDFGEEADPERRMLIARLSKQATAGLIFPFFPSWIQDTPLMDNDGVPRVAVMAERLWPQVDAVWLDFDALHRQVMSYLGMRDRKRLALISGPLNETAIADIKRAASVEDLRLDDDLCMSFPVSDPSWARRYMQTLMRLPAADRPDCVYIADDHVAEHVIAGLIRAGVRIGEDLDVVCHTNFPILPTRLVPVHAIGFDAAEILQACLDSLIRQRKTGRTGGDGPIQLIQPKCDNDTPSMDH